MRWASYSVYRGLEEAGMRGVGRKIWKILSDEVGSIGESADVYLGKL